MDNGVYIMLSRQQGLFRNLEVAANNIANMNTTGYQAEKLNFSEYLVENGKGKDSYADQPAAWRDTAGGSIKLTDNPFDLAISGEGYFQIQTPLGTRYTRAGAFQINTDGTLVTPDGYPVLSADGGEIAIPDTAKKIVINGAGQVSADGEDLGQVGVMAFKNTQNMKRLGNSLYSSTETPEPSETARIVQGGIESSNVQGVTEMTNLIKLQRSATSSAKFIEVMYELQRKTSSTYAKQSA